MGAHAGQRPESSGWNLIYQFTTFNDVTNFVYDVDNSSTAPSFTRILYQMKYNEYSVWCEFDDFTSNTATRIGVPLTWTYEVDVTNMYVYYNNPGSGFPQANQSTIYNRGPVNGRINFWPSNYGTTGGNNSLYDHDDTGYSGGNGYGSFQIFDIDPATPECVFAWNYWGQAVDDVGIGSRSTSHPDWTFADTGPNYTDRLCRIWVK